MAKQILFNEDARDKLRAGVDKLANHRPLNFHHVVEEVVQVVGRRRFDDVGLRRGGLDDQRVTISRGALRDNGAVTGAG
jgi:hypothetical protein